MLVFFNVMRSRPNGLSHVFMREFSHRLASKMYLNYTTACLKKKKYHFSIILEYYQRIPNNRFCNGQHEYMYLKNPYSKDKEFFLNDDSHTYHSLHHFARVSRTPKSFVRLKITSSNHTIGPFASG